MSTPAPPPGYVRSAQGNTELLARDWATAELARALEQHGSLFRWAEAQPSREPLTGRGVAWAVALPASADADDRTPVVVRHSRHGGLLAALTGDLFPLPTRAPRELVASARLTAGGVPTPEIIAVTVQPLAGLLARSDVMTRRLPPGREFPEAWRAASSADNRRRIIEAVAVLLRALGSTGAHHPDLNVKNIYVTESDVGATAYVLDVDRVSFAPSLDVAARNFARLARSIRKWNARHGLGVGDDALVTLAALAWVDQ